jgi:hypothetical protein
MVAVPAWYVLAVTTPVAFTVATTPLLVLHVPPEVASVSIVVLLVQTVAVPVIAAIAPIFTVVVLLQPVASVYVIKVLPELTPVTMPDDDPIVATPVF